MRITLSLSCLKFTGFLNIYCFKQNLCFLKLTLQLLNHFSLYSFTDAPVGHVLVCLMPLHIFLRFYSLSFVLCVPHIAQFPLICIVSYFEVFVWFSLTSTSLNRQFCFVSAFYFPCVWITLYCFFVCFIICFLAKKVNILDNTL